MRTLLRKALAPALGALIVAAPSSWAQDRAASKAEAAAGPSGFTSQEALDEHFDKQFEDLDRHRIGALADLAVKLPTEKAEAAYQELFHLAVTRDQFDVAARAAGTYLKSEKAVPQTRALASFIKVVAEADQNKADEALSDLDHFLKGAGAEGKKLDPTLMYAVGEAFLQRLISGGRYDLARKVCDRLIQGSTEDSVKQHFQGRLERIERLGKAAPPIAGTDIDGEKVNLADLKGKVVLIDFWATWCPPCIYRLPELNALRAKYKDQGFEVLGVNVDGSRAKADADRAGSQVRKFLIEHRVSWPNVLSGTGASDFAKAYGVGVIPANFLVDRDGQIVQFEQTGDRLEAAIKEALGGDKDKARAKGGERSR